MATAYAEALPGGYYRIMEAGSAKVEARLAAEPATDLVSIEKSWRIRHFPYAILAPSVLFAKKHPLNKHYGDPKMAALAIRIGDILADASEKGVFEPRQDSDWDIYMWLEAYRLVGKQLGAERDARWKKELLKNVGTMEERSRERLDFPWYTAPFLGTSPNHYALYAVDLLMGGVVLKNKEWQDLAEKILHRFAAEEQSVDGYWGEHSQRGPTTGYDYLTFSTIALYSEYNNDPAAITALRKGTDFHKHFTFLDGTPVDTVNDRNRFWSVNPWGNFGFSRFPDGRRYAEFLAGFFKVENVSIDDLGRISQDALYYHEGPTAPIPQDAARGYYQLHVPAGMRKSGPWQLCLSGIIDSAPVGNQFFIDRQGAVSIFHRDLGLVITGANSKRQPELATFSEKINGQVVNMPLTTRLKMSDKGDRLSLAYNTFFSDLFVPEPTDKEVKLRFVINGTIKPGEDAQLALQLCLKPGEVLETGSGKKITVGKERLELDGEALGGMIKHHGWSLKVDPSARLVWPIYPHNPYSNTPEASIRTAVAALSVPLKLKAVPGKLVIPGEQEIVFALSTP